MGKQFIRKSLKAAIYKGCNVRGVFLQYVKNTRFDGAIHFTCIESTSREQEFCFFWAEEQLHCLIFHSL